MENIYVGETPVTEIYLGEMGIKTVAVGGENLYTRNSSYIFLNLTTNP